MNVLQLSSLFLFSLLEMCVGNIHTSLNDMNSLLRTEGEVINTLQQYISIQQERLHRLKREVDERKAIHLKALESPHDFIGHPINAFLLVKKLSDDWTDMQNNVLRDPVGGALLANLNQKDLLWPSYADSESITLALLRVQETYQLKTTEMSRGKLKNHTAACSELKGHDCLKMGLLSYTRDDHLHVVQWMEECLEKMKSGSLLLSSPVDRGVVLDYLSYAAFKLGNYEYALRITDELIELNPSDVRFRDNKLQFQDIVNKQKDGVDVTNKEDATKVEEATIIEIETVAQNNNTTMIFESEYPTIFKTYKRLCRGEAHQNPEKNSKLNCRYQFGVHASFRIGPLKSETVHINPTIIMYYDVLTETQIEKFKQMAVPKFHKSGVTLMKGNAEVSNFRTSMSAGFHEEEDVVKVKAINDRVGMVTGLDVAYSGELQVTKYDFGGHYEPHHDYFEDVHGERSNRIATFLIYLSDVTAGGATVFPFIETTLWPKKGAAAFWYNLHPNGKGDRNTLHGACPILMGDKWISNKWIYLEGQEFIRQCGLNEEDL